MNEQELLNKILSSNEGRQLLTMLGNNNNVNAGFNTNEPYSQGNNWCRPKQCCPQKCEDDFGELGILFLFLIFFCGGCWF